MTRGSHAPRVRRARGEEVPDSFEVKFWNRLAELMPKMSKEKP